MTAFSSDHKTSSLKFIRKEETIKEKKMSKKPLDVKMDLLGVPKIQRMNAPTSPVSDDDEAGLGYHHTLVSNLINF